MEAEHLCVLVVEHDDAFARSLSGMLGRAPDAGVEITVARTLDAGLDCLAETSFDAVILGLFLPDGAGMANVTLLQAIAPQVPVVVIGAVDHEGLATEVVQAGAQDYLVKSQLSPRWLLRALRYAMERHQANEALVEAATQFRGLFDHLTEGIFRTTPEGRYMMANQALARIYGYASPEALMAGITDISTALYVQPGRREEFRRLMDEQDTITRFESPVFRRDGTVIWIAENCRAVRDETGRLLYYEGTVEDITQRRAAEEKVRHSEALYHSLVETLPQNIFRKDLQGRFTFANQQFCRTLNRDLAEIVGRTDADFFPPDLAAKYQQDDARVLASGQKYETIEHHRLPDGRLIYVQVVKTPLRGAYSQISGLQGIFWDITEQYLAEERLRQAHDELARSREALHAKNVQMEDDLKMAREIQLTILPQQYPVFPPDATPETSLFHFTHRYLPTGAVGGDFFNVTALSPTQAAIFLCDVAGHGVRSALIAAMIRALVEELHPWADDPGAFMTKLNEELGNILKHTGTPVMTTAVYLIADATDGTLRYTNAGHPKPVWLSAKQNTVAWLHSPNKQAQPPLGIFEKNTYQTAAVTLALRDRVLLYTDGLYEVEGANEQWYSQALLAAAIHKNAQQPLPQMLDTVLDEVRAFAVEHAFTDDVCLIGFELARHHPRKKARTHPPQTAG